MRALLALALCFVIAPAAAAPKAMSIPECRFFWDVALVARAMAMEGVGQRPRRNILGRIYDAKDDARLLALIAAINAAAQRKSERDAGEFAAAVREACIENRGDMNSVLNGRQT